MSPHYGGLFGCWPWPVCVFLVINYTECRFWVSVWIDPWEHLLAIGLGAGFGNAVASWEVRLQEDLDKKLQEVQSANNKRYIGNGDFSFVSSRFTVNITFTLFVYESLPTDTFTNLNGITGERYIGDGLLQFYH